MKSVAKTFRDKRRLLLKWFRPEERLESGVVEGFNNKLKLFTRKLDGFRTHEAYQNVLYYNFGALPEPNLPKKSSDEAKVFLPPVNHPLTPTGVELAIRPTAVHQHAHS